MKSKIKVFIYTIIGISLPFLIRTTLFSYTIRNIKSPYTTIYLHSLDIAVLLVCLLLFWKTKKLPFSGYKIVDKLWISLFCLILVQVLWTKYPLISWAWAVRFYLGASVIWYINRFQYLAKDLKYIIKGLFIGMLIQAIIVVIQFSLQKNIGLPIVVEPVLSTQLSGIAKVNVFDNTLIRGYGTFPHPNILGFSGILALIVLYATKLGKGVSMMIYLFTLILTGFIDHYIVTSIQAFSITIFTGLQLLYGNYIKLIKPFSRVLVLALHILILLSFSKTALTLLLLIDFVYLTFVARKSLFHVEQFQNKLKSIARIINNTLAIIGIMFLWILPYQQILDTIATRILYIKDSVQIISMNLWFGVGIGQYVFSLSSNRELWQYEPVHNIFLLLLSELGLINFSLLVVVISVECYTYIYGYKKQR